ncbi:MAG TPA: inositol monophosphatase family protein [Longimicrobiales bacterium]|nr:inositol monophosphatase family protein [Longimicrobiales bacterium]
MDPARLLETARAAADAAAEVHAAHRGRVRVADWSEKQAADFVTYVDREAEEAVVARLRADVPEHAILAEEGTSGTALHAAVARGAPTGPGERARALLAVGSVPEWLWVIDPLDGTTNYLHGYPMYASSVAVLHRGRVLAGAVSTSATGEAWWAARGGGAFHQGRRIHVSEIERMPQALIGTGFPFKALHLLPPYLGQFERVLRATAGVRRAGAAALDLCHLATGWLDGFWELVLAPWDFAAGALLVEEAGGIITALDGGDVVRGDGSVLAGNPTVHEALGGLVRGA